jgi:hypothetical protein
MDYVKAGILIVGILALFLPWLSMSMESTGSDSNYYVKMSLGIAPLWTSSDVSSENTGALTGFAVLIMEKYLEELKHQSSSVMWIFGIVPLILYGVSLIYSNRLLLISAGIMAMLFAGAFAGLVYMALNSNEGYKNFNVEEPVSMVELIKGVSLTETKYHITNESYVGMGIGWFLTMLVGISLIIYPFTGRYKAYLK